MMAAFMKIGVQFENVLYRGLRDFAFRLPTGAPDCRYVMHEVIEKSQHSLMFREFVQRTGLTVRGMAWWQHPGSWQVLRYARHYLRRHVPELGLVTPGAAMLCRVVGLPVPVGSGAAAA